MYVCVVLVGVGDGGGEGVVTCVVRVRTLCVRRASGVVRALRTRCTCVVRVVYVYCGGSGGKDRVRVGCIEVVSSCEKIACGRFGFTVGLHCSCSWLHWGCSWFKGTSQTYPYVWLKEFSHARRRSGQEHINRQGPEGAGGG